MLVTIDTIHILSMAQAQQNLYAKHSHIPCPLTLIVSTDPVFKIPELGMSITFIVSIFTQIPLNSTQVRETQPRLLWIDVTST
jgi:hypothetical protein